MFSHLFRERKFSKLFLQKYFWKIKFLKYFFLGQQMTNHIFTSLDQSFCTDKGIIFIQFILKLSPNTWNNKRMDPRKTIKEIRSLRDLESLLPKFLLNPVYDLSHSCTFIQKSILIVGLPRDHPYKREMKTC